MKKYETLAALFAEKDVWCQKLISMGKDGHYCNVRHDPDGTDKVCFTGGIIHVYGHDPKKESEVYSKVIAHLKPEKSIGIWNDADDRTQEQVHAVCVELGI